MLIKYNNTTQYIYRITLLMDKKVNMYQQGRYILTSKENINIYVVFITFLEYVCIKYLPIVFNIGLFLFHVLHLQFEALKTWQPCKYLGYFLLCRNQLSSTNILTIWEYSYSFSAIWSIENLTCKYLWYFVICRTVGTG